MVALQEPPSHSRNILSCNRLVRYADAAKQMLASMERRSKPAWQEEGRAKKIGRVRPMSISRGRRQPPLSLAPAPQREFPPERTSQQGLSKERFAP